MATGGWAAIPLALGAIRGTAATGASVGGTAGAIAGAAIGASGIAFEVVLRKATALSWRIRPLHNTVSCVSGTIKANRLLHDTLGNLSNRH